MSRHFPGLQWAWSKCLLSPEHPPPGGMPIGPPRGWRAPCWGSMGTILWSAPGASEGHTIIMQGLQKRLRRRSVSRDVTWRLRFKPKPPLSAAVVPAAFVGSWPLPCSWCPQHQESANHPVPLGFRRPSMEKRVFWFYHLNLL